MKPRLLLCAMSIMASYALGARDFSFEYDGRKITPDRKNLYVDGSLSDSQAASSEYVFNDFNEAMASLTGGSMEEPMRVFIAPWVYWIDDPDDPTDRIGEKGAAPIGLAIHCDGLQLIGLSDDPRDVVLASARGQTQGAVGNFTMFDFYGDDLVFRNLTMGNYCNTDLEYPLKPELGRKKRNSAITQAQLAFCHGERVFAENVRFVARLNLCPLAGARRLLFKDCHFELTDDSLSSGVYIGCDFDFYGRQPYGNIDTYGSVFMDCDLNIMHDSAVQAISKSLGRHSLVDCRFHSEGGRPVELAWTFRPEDWLRCFQYDISFNGMPAFVGARKPTSTVLLDQKALLGAYRLEDESGEAFYNSWNLLRGEDGWDPLHVKDKVAAASRRDGIDYGAMATCLDIDLRDAVIQTGKEGVKLNAGLWRHMGYRLDNEVVHWKIQSGFEKFARLSDGQGYSCVVYAENHDETEKTFDVIAYTGSGLECAVRLTVLPDYLPAPEFVRRPEISMENGSAKLSYGLMLDGRKDESSVNWYRCTDKNGNGAIKVAVSRFGTPKMSYSLSRADEGYYIMAGVSPKHRRCEAGKEVFTVSPRPADASQVSREMVLETDFTDFPSDNQLELIPGFWTVDAYKPADTHAYDWTPDTSRPCWTYGSGINGAKGFGLQPVRQGARLRYTPVAGDYGDMKVSWQIDPAKDGGQGFASARMQYLDLFIKFDTQKLSGYALRLIRTTKYANAVDALLVRYTDGQVTPVSESVTIDCFLTGCVLSVWTEGSKLYAQVEGPGRIAALKDDPAVKHSAMLSADIETNAYGGFGLQHTSTTGPESRIMLHHVKAEWQ